MLIMIKCLVICLVVCLAVGFFTMLERKVLGYIQLRKGVNKVSFIGLTQPLADAAKLFLKEIPQMNLVNKYMYLIMPIFAMLIMFSLWYLYISLSGMGFVAFGILFFLCVSSLNVYAILLSGWASSNKYSLLGSVRAVSQTISYEVSMALILMIPVGMSVSFDLNTISQSPYPMMLSVMMFHILVLWFVSALAETNRAPFDLAEGESELVSGFNVEYGGGEFAFLFIAEYGSILLMSVVTQVLFFTGYMMNFGLSVMVISVSVSFCFLWVRSSYPRMRYDHLMSFTWKTILSLVLALILLLAPFWNINS